MPRIRPLSQTVISQIAAGEVIERPAAVVKELLENSLDAGATRIDIELTAGGTDSIVIVDDGCGILPEDLGIAFAPHATSKLQTVQDLEEIGTLGFRGEALASVGSVAQVLLQSRPLGEPRGAQITCHGGELSEVRPWGGPVGTRIEVKHLFYNVPVRKKFLKSVATELGHVCEAVTRIALAYPTLHIVLHHNGRLVYEVPATASLADRIGLFFGKEIMDALYEVASPPGTIRLYGYIADPKCDRGNAKLQYLFVNGRWIRDRSLSHAIQEAYRNLLMVGRYAIAFLFLELPAQQVDVNVHPTKSEVRFRENSVLYSLVRSTLKARLLNEALVPSIQVPRLQIDAPPELPQARLPFPSIPTPIDAAQQRLPAEFPFVNPPEARQARLIDEETKSTSPRRTTAETTLAPWEMKINAEMKSIEAIHQPEPSKPAHLETTPPPVAPADLPTAAYFNSGAVLQVHDAYLVLETPEGLQVIDQHALHERILFEQFRRRIRDGKLEVQRLLIPEPIDLTAPQAAAVLEHQEALAMLGLEVQDFGGHTILLSSYPTLMNRRTPRELFLGIVDELTGKERPPSREGWMDHLLATMACKAAVKAGDRLSQEEIHYLLQLREFAEESHHCPHGRPTSLFFSRHELDRQFRR